MCGSVRIQIVLKNSANFIEAKIFTTAFKMVKNVRFSQTSPGCSDFRGEADFKGTSDFKMDLADNWGRQLANGVYYIVVTTPTLKATTKLLILR